MPPARLRRLPDIRRELRAALPELRRRYPIAYLGIFGSWVRGEQTAGSDLDLLVDFDGPIDLFAYVRLQEELALLRIDSLCNESEIVPSRGRGRARGSASPTARSPT